MHACMHVLCSSQPYAPHGPTHPLPSFYRPFWGMSCSMCRLKSGSSPSSLCGGTASSSSARRCGPSAAAQRARAAWHFRSFGAGAGRPAAAACARRRTRPGDPCSGSRHCRAWCLQLTARRRPASGVGRKRLLQRTSEGGEALPTVECAAEREPQHGMTRFGHACGRQGMMISADGCGDVRGRAGCCGTAATRTVDAHKQRAGHATLAHGCMGAFAGRPGMQPRRLLGRPRRLGMGSHMRLCGLGVNWLCSLAKVPRGRKP